MPRKFVTGGAGKVIITKKREPVEASCQGCGNPVTIMSDHVGDILCPTCMGSKGYELHVE